jgi:hypothetical protein
MLSGLPYVELFLFHSLASQSHSDSSLRLDVGFDLAGLTFHWYKIKKWEDLRPGTLSSEFRHLWYPSHTNPQASSKKY